MKKNILITAFFFFITFQYSYSQIGINTVSPKSILDVNGSFGTNTQYISADTELTINEHTVIYNGAVAATNPVITLPVDAVTGRQYVIVNSSENTIEIKCKTAGYTIKSDAVIKLHPEYTVTLVRNANNAGSIWEKISLIRNEYEAEPSLESSWVSVNSDINGIVNIKQPASYNKEGAAAVPIGTLGTPDEINYGSLVNNSTVYLSISEKYDQKNKVFVQWSLWGHILGPNPTGVTAKVFGQFRFNAAIYKLDPITSTYKFDKLVYSISLADFDNQLGTSVEHFTNSPALYLEDYNKGNYKIELTYVVLNFDNIANKADFDKQGIAFYGCVAKGDVFVERQF